MANQNKSKLAKALTAIVVLALLVGAVIALLLFMGIKKQDINDLVNPVFRVECNGVTYTGADNTLILPQEGKLKFDVKCTNGYKLKVTPNVTAETDFTYSVAGHEYPYSEEDLSGYVVADDDIYGDCFYIDCAKDNTVKSVLSRMWGGAEITLNVELQYPYKLIVTSDSGEDISILLCPYKLCVTLTPDHVIF